MNNVTFYYFSPTGGTKKCGELFCKEISQKTVPVDLGSKHAPHDYSSSDVAVFAAPVFGGRIPRIVTDQIQKLDGNGRYAVTMAVYGNRAYEDALLELNNTVTARGFQVIASCACIAQHSMVPEVAKGRPDDTDIAGIRSFAGKVADKLAKRENKPVEVPGSEPYKEEMAIPATPISLPSCISCGKCQTACPVNAITYSESTVVTDPEKCILCMSCTAVCPAQARILPPPLKEKLEQMLAPAKAARCENEYYL